MAHRRRLRNIIEPGHLETGRRPPRRLVTSGCGAEVVMEGAVPATGVTPLAKGAPYPIHIGIYTSGVDAHLTCM